MGSKGDRSLQRTFCPWLLTLLTAVGCAGTAEWDPQPHSELSPASRAETITL